MSRDLQVAAIAAAGAAVIAKAIVDGGVPGLTEPEFTKILFDEAQKGRLASESPEQAFSRYFADKSEEGKTIRRAHALTKRLPSFPGTVISRPSVVSGVAALNSNDDNSAARRQLTELIEAEMRTAPWLTPAQATARVEAAQRATVAARNAAAINQRA